MNDLKSFFKANVSENLGNASASLDKSTIKFPI